MTKAEKAAIRKAVKLLWQEEQDWEGAMEILLPMAGLRSRAMDAIKTAKPITIDQLWLETQKGRDAKID